MASDDEDLRDQARLQQLGLEHLAGKPEELKRALDRLADERKRAEEEGERERLAILGRNQPAGTVQPAKTPTASKPAPTRKTSTLVIATRAPGTCTTCRHSNQETQDFEEGHLFCWMAKEPRRPSQPCDVTRRLPQNSTQDPSSWAEYHLYQPYDGANGTFGRSTDLRMMAEDADEGLQRSLQASLPIIEG
ncbi:MAG: hypothetical protein U1E65_11365 [Myxococcota bacterium]